MFKQDEDKIFPLDSEKDEDASLIVGCAGPQGDRTQFCEFIQKNVILTNLRTGVRMSPRAASAYTRGELATALRSRGAYQANLLLAGVDKIDGPELYWMDYMASFAKVNFGAHGYASNFIISVFDREYKYDMSVEEALEVVKKCLHELKTRFLIHQPNFSIKIVDKDGIRPIEL